MKLNTVFFSWRRWFFVLVTCAGLLAGGCSTGRSDGAAGRKGSGSGTPAAPVTLIRVSAIPDENPTALMRKYQPLVLYLEQSLGVKVQYFPVTDYGAVVVALAAGKVDFAWLGGFTYVQASYQASVEPLCMRQADRHFKSVFLAGRSSGIETPKDLKGKTFAFGSRSSTSGHLMPRHFLIKRWGFDPDSDFRGIPAFSGSHDATIKMVESGMVDAGAVNALVWKRVLRERKVDSKKLKVIYTTPDYVDYVWVARKAVPRRLRDRFREAFLRLDASVKSDSNILRLQDAQKFVKADRRDFDQIEKVALSTGLLKPRAP